MSTKKNLTTVCSLFAGIGGIDLAFMQAGFNVIWANEFDRYACETYRSNFSDTLLIEDDIKNIDTDCIPDFDILTAGFPCQPFSVCGHKAGFTDKRGHAFFEIMRIVNKKHPELIFLENVANLVKHDNGKTFDIIKQMLSANGYRIKYFTADACDYGLPQHRTRIYITAFKSDNLFSNYYFPRKHRQSVKITDVIDITKKQNEQFYEKQGSVCYDRLCQVMVDRKQLYRFSDYGIQASRNGISFTLKANMGTWNNRIPYIKDDYGIRKITPYECLALMGFPKEFRFPDIPISEAYKQCGNTVVVPLIKEIAENIKYAERAASGFTMT